MPSWPRARVVSFATDEPHYRRWAERFAGHVEIVPPFACKRDATLFKPTFIKMSLATFGSVVWLDVDCELHAANPLPAGCDVGTVADPWGNHPITAGVLFFHATGGAFRLLGEWDKECEKPGPWGDHKRLCDVLARANWLRVKDMTGHVSATLRGATGRDVRYV